MQWAKGAVAFASAAAALAGAAQEEQAVFRVTTQRVIIEFIAVDKDGNPVTDLGKDEITVEFEEKKQKVDRLFPPLAAAAQPDSGGPLPAGLDALAAAPQRVPIRTAILLDSRNMDSQNFHRTRRALRRFIKESLQDDHFLMIAEIDRSLEILTPFTRDREALLKAVGDLKPALLTNPLDSSRLNFRSARNYTDELAQQMTYLYSGLRVLMHSISAYPGRKHLVFFSEGYLLNSLQSLEFANQIDSATGSIRYELQFQDAGVIPALKGFISLANSYGVSFYTTDVRGVMVRPGLTARVAQDFLIAMAVGTNGTAVYNSNNLGRVLEASTREQRLVYQASVVPEREDSQKYKFRPVAVKTTRPGVTIRAQAGFYNLDTRQLAGLRIGQAFNTPRFFKALRPLCEVKPKGAKMEVTFGIEGSQISFAPSQSDLKRVSLFFVGQVYKKNGDPAFDSFPIVRPFALEISSQQFEALTSQPLVGHQELSLPSGRYRLVFVAEDRLAGTLGASEVEFKVD